MPNNDVPTNDVPTNDVPNKEVTTKDSANLRRVQVSRTGAGTFVARNARGGEISIGSGGDNPDFSPVELLLAAIAGCSGIDVDIFTTRRSEPEVFEIEVTAQKSKDDSGNHLSDIEVNFTLRFPDGEAGDAARAVVDDSIQRSHDRLCTVSRTVERATPVTMRAR